MGKEDRAGDPQSRTREDRVSNSKSGFTESDFILVFKTSDGTYTSPRKIPRKAALAIAANFSANAKSAKEFGISKSVAKFIQAKAIRHGFLAPPSADEEVPNIAEFGTDVGPAELEPAQELKPKYFPKIDPYSKPDFTTQCVESIAFILSGVDPEQLQDSRVMNGAINLQQLVQTSTARVSPGLLLQDDHWYVLSHLHHLSLDAFKSTWEEAHAQGTGQSNTDVVKLMTKLEKFRIDSAAKCLEDPTNKNFFTEVEFRSIDVLSRLFRRTRRKIEVVHEEHTAQPVKKSVFDFLRRNPAKQVVSPVQAEVSEIVQEYLTYAVKIGRILRSKALRSNRPHSK